MIVVDVSSIVGAALKADSVHERALLHAARFDVLVVSSAVEAELRTVLARPRFASLIVPERREAVIRLVMENAVSIEPTVRVQACRDPGDDMYLELALAAGASTIISSDADLLSLNPWQGIRILKPASYLAAVRPG